MNFYCIAENCKRRFKTELNLDSHLLFNHQVLKPQCINYDLLRDSLLIENRLTSRHNELMKFMDRRINFFTVKNLRSDSCYYRFKSEIHDLLKIEVEMKKRKINIMSYSYELGILLNYVRDIMNKKGFWFKELRGILEID